MIQYALFQVAKGEQTHLRVQPEPSDKLGCDFTVLELQHPTVSMLKDDDSTGLEEMLTNHE